MSEITQNPNSILPTKLKKPTTNTNTNTKRSKPMKTAKQQPLKVVYISNPMKIQTSPAQFRTLVQELTGRDATDWADPTRISQVSHDDNNENQNVEPDSGYVADNGVEVGGQLPGQPETVECIGSDQGCVGLYDDHDHDFDDHMLGMEDFASFYHCL